MTVSWSHPHPLCTSEYCFSCLLEGIRNERPQCYIWKEKDHVIYQWGRGRGRWDGTTRTSPHNIKTLILFFFFINLSPLIYACIYVCIGGRACLANCQKHYCSFYSFSNWKLIGLYWRKGKKKKKHKSSKRYPILCLLQ